MVRRSGFEEVAMAIIGIFVLVAIVSTLSPQLGTLMSGIFFLFIILILVALIIKIIEAFNRIF